MFTCIVLSLTSLLLAKELFEAESEEVQAQWKEVVGKRHELAQARAKESRLGEPSSDPEDQEE